MSKTQDLEQLGDQVPKVVPGVDLRELSIGPEEAFVFSRIDGRTSVKNIAITTGLPTDRVAQAVHTLQALGALEGAGPVRTPPRASGKRSTSSAGSQRYAAPLAPPEPSVPEEGSLQARPNDLANRIDVMWSRLAQEDYYQLFGVARDADRKSIKAAYFEIIAEFHPDKYYRQLNAELKGRVEVVFQKLTTAHETLTRGKKRSEYDATLVESGESKQRPLVGPPAPRPDSEMMGLADHAMTQPSIPRPAPIPGSVRTTIRTPARKLNEAGTASNPARDPGMIAPSVRPVEPGPATQPRPDQTARMMHRMNDGSRSDNPTISARATLPAENSAAAREAAAKFAAMTRRTRASSFPPHDEGHDSPTLRPTARPSGVTAESLTAATRPTLRPSMAPPEPPEARINRYIKDAELHLREANAVAASNALRLASSLAQSSGHPVERLTALEHRVSTLLFESNLQSAQQHERKREWTNAGRYYAKAAKGEQSGELYVQAARCYRQGGRKREALEQAEAAVGARPGNSAAYELLGQIYEETGEIARAIAQLEKALSLKPNDDAIKSQIARLKRGKTGA